MGKKKFYIVLLILWFFIILLLSGQTGEETRKTSFYLIEKLYRFFPNLAFKNEMIHLLMRKLAHIIIYSGLTLLVYNLVNTMDKWKLQVFKITFIFCSLFSVLEEGYKELFVSGRHFDILDVLINIIAILITLGCCKFKKQTENII